MEKEERTRDIFLSAPWHLYQLMDRLQEDYELKHANKVVETLSEVSTTDMTDATDDEWKLSAFGYLESKMSSLRLSVSAPLIASSFSLKLKNIVQQLIWQTAHIRGGDHLPSDPCHAEVLDDIPRISGKLTVFLLRYGVEEEDVSTILAQCVVYLSSFLSPSLIHHFRQLTSWYGTQHVIYFSAFLAYTTLIDEPLPLLIWAQLLSESKNAMGPNASKCVRNILKMRRYRLLGDADSVTAIASELLGRRHSS